jgi:hypothetical protein
MPAVPTPGLGEPSGPFVSVGEGWWEYSRGPSTIGVRGAAAEEARRLAEEHLRDLGLAADARADLREAWALMREAARRGRRR